MPHREGYEERFTWGLIRDVFDVLERHGYQRGDHRHVGQAIGLLLDAATAYERRSNSAPLDAAGVQPPSTTPDRRPQPIITTAGHSDGRCPLSERERAW
jgi:hypothetical protein